ncbi:TetR/AcrR family transcriptional regulator [Nocardia seriolae]|uniref:Transcriptional regulator n=1 Tax=Nocardia seriolae TaxID=37332 RepID=A0ABC9YYY2_9NOCA|nr:TetR/AcrR family transcriptional regulator [Nocardia seriolae]BEK94967.1 TetR/AcrR family transcriptional regulator [Nocardia seriolae]GAM48345.1 TetR family transcriptional regulator [Nocardia seriolae]GAP30311.1 transcriptional regulator [Nocardia seriolae]
MATSVEQGRETRARLMAAAVDLVAEHGWGEVTTRMVADRAGVRPGLVHYHFASVTDLLIDTSVQAARREYESVMAGVMALPGPEAMRGMLAAIAAYTTIDPTTVVMTEMMLAATRHERLRAELGGLVAEARTVLARWFRDNSAVADPEATAAVVVALLDGLILHRLIDSSLGAVDVTGPLLRAAGLTECRTSEGKSDEQAGGGGPGR